VVKEETVLVWWRKKEETVLVWWRKKEETVLVWWRNKEETDIQAKLWHSIGQFQNQKILAKCKEVLLVSCVVNKIAIK
jgi:hypothetical protein